MRIRTRLALLFLGLLSIPIAAMSIVALDYSVGIMIDDLYRSADLLAQQIFEQMQVDLIAGSKDPAMAIEKSPSLRRLLDSTQAYGQGVVSASIITPNGMVLAGANGQGEGGAAPGFKPIANLREHASSWLPFYLVGEFWAADVYELRRPVFANGHQLATISVGVTTALIADRLHRVLVIILVTALADILVAWLVLSVTMNRVFSHLNRVLRRFEELASSGVAVEINLAGEAELDALTDKFNALSRRVRNERTQMASYDHLFDFVRSMRDAILMIDAGGSILFANQRAREILAPGAEKIEGEALKTALDQDHQLVTLATSAIRTGIEAHDLTMELTGRGSFLVTLFRVGRGRTPAGLLVILRDLQPVIELETALDYSNRLARLGALISGVAHQLRSPLHGMNLRLELLSSDGGERVQRHVDKLRQEIQRLDISIEALLRFMRPEDLKITCFDANQLMRELGARVASEHVRVVYELAEHVPAIRGDRAMLSEALGNVITNAVQAMPQGGVLTLQSRRSGEHVELRVVDTGVGIEPGKLDQIFDLYYTTKPGGTGLGLSLALRGIELNNGTIEIESRVAEGTTCRIKLPASAEEAPDDAPCDAA